MIVAQHSFPRSTSPCPGCGAADFITEYTGDEGKRMKQTGECFSCASWEIRLSAPNPDRLIINGWVYSVGQEPSEDRLRSNRVSMLGMAGRRFDIELADGRRFTTHNLWSGGEVPARYRDRLPDTAKFVGGERDKAGDITCWNPADRRAPRYPAFHSLKSAR